MTELYGLWYELHRGRALAGKGGPGEMPPPASTPAGRPAAVASAAASASPAAAASTTTLSPGQPGSPN
eukprot:146004-Alexandrium_andersonii.AAC.1